MVLLWFPWGIWKLKAVRMGVGDKKDALYVMNDRRS
jgi:hypothetical protein